MKQLLTVLFAAMFAVASVGAIAQTKDEPKKTAKAKPAKTKDGKAKTKAAKSKDATKDKAAK
jgi:hypothetical protein